MTEVATIEDVIAKRYSALSAKMRDAADFVAQNQVDVATRSLRSVSTASGVSPATLSRLARVLGFSSYEDMREVTRNAVGERVVSFSEKAGLLRAGATSRVSMIERQAAACIDNIAAMRESTDRQRLDQAVDLMLNARNVVLFGAFGSTGIVEYMAYLANYFATNWTLAGRMGASLGSVLAALDTADAVLIVTKSPYAKRAIVAAEIARARGADVILITDSHSCPAIPHATVHFIVPSDSPQFFSSYAATLVLMETIIAMIVSRSDNATTARISAVEEKNKGLGEFWSE